MKLHRLHKNAFINRARTIKFIPNLAGQGGHTNLTFELDDEYFTIEFESEAEVKQLLSQAHIIFHNWSDHD